MKILQPIADSFVQIDDGHSPTLENRPNANQSMNSIMIDKFIHKGYVYKDARAKI